MWVRPVLMSVLFGAVLAAPAQVTGYEMPVQRPACDESDPSTRIIATASDFDDINSSQYHIFCVRPGDYSAVSVRLTADGTQAQPRYLVYDDPSGTTPATTHPVKMSIAQRAELEELIFDNASWWVVQGLFIDGGQRLSPSGTGIDFLDSSSNNVVDRVVVQHGAGTLVQIEHGSSYNAVQNSVIRETDADAANPSKDYHCIHIKGDSPGTLGNRIVRNEIYDCAGDSVHFSGCPYWRYDAHAIGYDCNWQNDKANRFAGDARGTILFGNDMYITADFRDVCGGTCSCMENAVDIKSTMGTADRASLTGDDWVRIEQNRMWNDCARSGAAIIAHYENTDYVLVRHNIIHSWNHLYRPTVKDDPFVDHHSVIGNVFADAANVTNVSKVGRDIEFYKNTWVHIDDGGNNLAGYGDSGNLDLQCNAFVDAGGWSIPEAMVHSDYNSYYASASFGSGANDQSFPDVSDAQMQDLCFERKIWTGPETHCIPDAAATAQSPHLSQCPSDLGAYANVGVHDSTDQAFFTWYHEATAPLPPDPQPEDWTFSPVAHFGDFENYDATERSRWTIAEVDGDDRLFLHTSAYQAQGELPGEVAVAQARTFGDFELTLEVKTGEDLSVNGFADFVIVFGYEDAANYHMLLAHHDASITRLFRVDNGTRSELPALGVSMLPDQAWHTVGLSYQSGRLDIEFDGASIWTGSLPDVPSGRVGLGAFDESVYFDNFDVVTPAVVGEDIGDADTGGTDTASADTGAPDAASDDTGLAQPDALDGDDTSGGDDAPGIDPDEPPGTQGSVGCGCNTTSPGSAPHLWLMLIALGVMLRRGARITNHARRTTHHASRPRSSTNAPRTTHHGGAKRRLSSCRR